MNTRLMAFWKYDQFPYILGAEITKLNDEGLVYSPSYMGWFKPKAILPYDTGVKIRNSLIQLRFDYDCKLAELKGEYIEKAIEIADFI